MRKRNSFIISSLALLIFMYSFGSGPAKRGHDKTGSTLSDGKCMDCHSAGKFDVSLDIKLYDGEEEVNKYIPGKKYVLKYIIKNTGNPSKYGFQTVSLNSENKDAGSFENIPSGFHSSDHQNVTYIEHDSPRNVGFLNLDWVAPDSGSGDVSIYAGSIAANGNGGTSGDGGAVSKLVLSEQTTSSIDINKESKDIFTILSNPVSTTLAIKLKGSSTISKGRIISLSGQIVKEFLIEQNSRNINLSIDNIKPGLYIVQMQQGNDILSKRFVIAGQ